MARLLAGRCDGLTVRIRVSFDGEVGDMEMGGRMSYMKKSMLVIGVLFFFSLQSMAAKKPLTPLVATSKSSAAKRSDFQAEMRRLWEDHITWTRLFIVSAIGDLPDKAATTDRLLQNQVDIGNAVKPYYGDAAGEKLTALLKKHITTAADLVAAAKANNAVKMKDATNRWYANADEIATFLSGANPKNWPVADMNLMMREHLDLTTEEAVAHLKGNWKSDIGAYDKIHRQILQMADMLSEGIIKQFPAKFE